LDDRALDAAIAACAGRGGTVFVPAGVFLTGGVQLRSNMAFHLAGGAILRGSPRLSDYRAVGAPSESGSQPDRSILTATGVNNLSINGAGTLDGSDAAFWSDPSHRPTAILDLGQCHNVSIRGVTFLDPARYHARMVRCSNMVVDGITMRAPILAPNSDGLQTSDSAAIRSVSPIARLKPATMRLC
jgi:polygalacturonase